MDVRNWRRRVFDYHERKLGEFATRSRDSCWELLNRAHSQKDQFGHDRRKERHGQTVDPSTRPEDQPVRRELGEQIERFAAQVIPLLAR